MKNLVQLKINVIFFSLAICILTFIGNTSVFAQTGCNLVNKNEPVFYVSFDRIIERNKKRIVQLRLNNNSTCTIVVPVRFEEKSENEYVSKACVPSTFGELENNSLAFLSYNITDSRTNTIYFPFGGDVLDSALLKGGNSVIFEVPVKEIKKGDFSLEFLYDWEVCNDRKEMIILHRKLTFYSSELQKQIK